MSIFDIFRKREPIIAPWKKYYTDDELDIKIPNISLYTQIVNSSKKYPDNTAYQYFKKKVKYKSFVKKINRCASSFKKKGIRKGDIVTICLPNVPEALICFYALNKIGGIANMIHPLSAEEEIKKALISTNSKYLIIIDFNYEKIKKSVKSTNVKNVIFVSAKDSMPFFMRIGYTFTEQRKYKNYHNTRYYLSYKRFLRCSFFKKSNNYCPYGKDTPCVIMHSGGTSGKPKNIVLQNRTFILGAKQEKIALKKLTVGDNCLGIMPNFHGFGLGVCMHTPLTLGCYTILVPKFDNKEFDVLLDTYKPTCVLGVPTLYEALLKAKNVDNLDLSHLKYVICGGDSLSKKLEDDINKYLKDHNCDTHIVQGYGMSEALAAVTLCFDNTYKSGSIGIPLPGNYVKIIDPSTRKILPYGKTGEIVINSKALMMGYLNDESETNEALQVHDDGHIWLHTGDLGYMDSDGFIFYESRAKRMIITSGYNVYPSHIEEVIEAHPAVLQCTVVGVYHPYKHEVPKAFIVLKPGYYGLLIKQEIKDYCVKNLAHYMVPKEFVYRRKLPTTKLGKVDFNLLKSDVGKDEL